MSCVTDGLLTKLEVKIIGFFSLFMDRDEFSCSRALETFQFRFPCVYLFSLENGSEICFCFVHVKADYAFFAKIEIQQKKTL